MNYLYNIVIILFLYYINKVNCDIDIDVDSNDNNNLDVKDSKISKLYSRFGNKIDKYKPHFELQELNYITKITFAGSCNNTIFNNKVFIRTSSCDISATFEMSPQDNLIKYFINKIKERWVIVRQYLHYVPAGYDEDGYPYEEYYYVTNQETVAQSSFRWLDYPNFEFVLCPASYTYSSNAHCITETSSPTEEPTTITTTAVTIAVTTTRPTFAPTGIIKLYLSNHLLNP